MSSSSLAVALWLTLSAQTPQQPTAEPAPAGPARFRGALELSAMSFPSGPPGGAQDMYVVGFPLLSFDGGPDFGIELGAPLRLRVFDDPPAQRAQDHGGILRREDWSELSDYGQILRELRVGSESDAFRLRVGALTSYTLGHGQLVSRYSNATNPDYHPAGASLVAFIGPTRTELFASDILAGRVFGGAVSVDLGRTFDAAPATWDRWHAGIELVHDAGRAGGIADPVTLAWVSVDGVLLRGSEVQFSGHLGGGGSYVGESPDFGATLGLAIDAQPSRMRLGGKLELRKQHGTFRQGLIGSDYELARFSATGLGRTPIAQEELPDDWSLYGEMAFAIGGGDDSKYGEPDAVISVAAERYLWGRTNLDLAVSGRAIDDRLVAGARFGVTGIGEAPRYLLGLDGRWRFMPSLYALLQGGTVFFPQPDGGLSRGVYAGVGVGADFQR